MKWAVSPEGHPASSTRGGPASRSFRTSAAVSANRPEASGESATYEASAASGASSPCAWISTSDARRIASSARDGVAASPSSRSWSGANGGALRSTGRRKDAGGSGAEITTRGPSPGGGGGAPRTTSLHAMSAGRRSGRPSSGGRATTFTTGHARATTSISSGTSPVSSVTGLRRSPSYRPSGRPSGPTTMARNRSSSAASHSEHGGSDGQRPSSTNSRSAAEKSPRLPASSIKEVKL